MGEPYQLMIFCDHANEWPRGICQCPHDCGCRERMCPGLPPMTMNINHDYAHTLTATDPDDVCTCSNCMASAPVWATAAGPLHFRPEGVNVTNLVAYPNRLEIATQILSGMLSSSPIADRTQIDKRAWVKIALQWADILIAESENV